MGLMDREYNMKRGEGGCRGGAHHQEEHEPYLKASVITDGMMRRTEEGP
jgi:hypothetical protein